MIPIELNIGMNNVPLHLYDLIDTLKELGLFKMSGFKYTLGQYNGEPEDTLVLHGFMNKMDNSELIKYWEDIAQILCQDCIALRTSTIEALAYSPTYSGTKMKFDHEFFIKF